MKRALCIVALAAAVVVTTGCTKKKGRTESREQAERAVKVTPLTVDREKLGHASPSHRDPEARKHPAARPRVTPIPPTPPPAPRPVPSPGPTAGPTEPPPPPPPPGREHPGLRDPSQAQGPAPDKFKVEFDTTAGTFVVEVTRAWSPNGADRLFNLVRVGYFRDIAFFRVVSGFMAQFGVHGDPSVSRKWQSATIKDDEVVESNHRGYLTFAKTGRPHSRSTQFFINLVDNKRLDRMGFSPVGKVVQGMDAVDKLYSGYGEGAPRGSGPDQQRIQREGNAYLRAQFPELDYIRSAIVTK